MHDVEVSLACDRCGYADVEDETGFLVILMTMMPATLPDCEYFGMEIVEMEIVGRDLTNWTLSSPSQSKRRGHKNLQVVFFLHVPGVGSRNGWFSKLKAE